MLLDTHVWLWVAEGDARRVGRRARRLIEQARTAGALRVSTASIFELAALHTAGRIHLARPTETWVRDSIDTGRLTLIDVTMPIALDAGLIPAPALPDPVDRLIVASARHLGVRLVTRDQPLLDYARTTGQVRVINAAT